MRRRTRIAPGLATATAIEALFVDEIDEDGALVSIPHPQVQLVVRYGTMARGLVDVHAFGVRPRAHRKAIRAGQRAVTARLHVGASARVLGVPASALAGRTVPLDELWGDAAMRPFLEQLAAAHGARDAAAVVERAIAARLEAAVREAGPAGLARAAADRLATTAVRDVAAELGVSERHLRRLFRDAVGTSPKAFVRLTRFHRALAAAQRDRRATWAASRRRPATTTRHT